MKKYSKFLLLLFIIINESLRIFIPFKEYYPYFNLISGLIIFIFSFNNTTIVSRILFCGLYSFSFIIDEFVFHLPPYLILFANLIIVVSTIKKKDINLLHLVISILNFILLYRYFDNLFWVCIIFLNLMILLACVNNINISPVILYNVAALFLPNIRWDYSYVIFGICILLLYFSAIKKNYELFNYRIILFPISFSLFFIKINPYIALMVFILLFLPLVFLRNNLQDIYDYLNRIFYDDVGQFVKKMYRRIIEIDVGAIQSQFLSVNYHSFFDKLQQISLKVNFDIIVVFFLFILIMFFLFKLYVFVKGIS